MEWNAHCTISLKISLQSVNLYFFCAKGRFIKVWKETKIYLYPEPVESLPNLRSLLIPSFFFHLYIPMDLVSLSSQLIIIFICHLLHKLLVSPYFLFYVFIALIYGKSQTQIKYDVRKLKFSFYRHVLSGESSFLPNVSFLNTIFY